MDTISLAVATVLAGLSAGVLYGWRVSVIPGTRGTSSATYVETMQSINRAILNPGFFVVFLGAPVAIAVAGVIAWVENDGTRLALLATALVVYLSTTIATTAIGNIPLNDELDRLDADGAGPDEVERARTAYERPWNRWHDVRTISSSVTFVLCVAASLSGAS